MTDKQAIHNSARLLRLKGYGVELAGDRILLGHDDDCRGTRASLLVVLPFAASDEASISFDLLMKILGDSQIGEFCRHATLQLHTWRDGSTCEVVELTPEDFFALHLNQQGRFR